ncbi:MAG: hypothetical protein AAFV80_22170, partial [Bacteroidota bacterium]
FQVGFAKSIYQPKLKQQKAYPTSTPKPQKTKKSKTSPKGTNYKDSPRNIVPETDDSTPIPESQPAPVVPNSGSSVEPTAPKAEPEGSPKKPNPIVDVLKKEGELLKRETENEIKNDVRRERSQILNELRKARRNLRQRAKERIKAPLKDN